MLIAILLIVGTVAVIGICSALNGWALTILWGWFIVPVFHLPVLTTVQGIGIAMIVAYLAKDISLDDDKKEDATERLAKQLGYGILRPFLVLGLGWIVTLFL